MKIKYLFPFLSLISMTQALANPYDRCSDVLHKGVFNTTISNNKHGYDFEKNLAFCKSYKRHIDSEQYRNRKEDEKSNVSFSVFDYFSLTDKRDNNYSLEEKQKLVDEYYRNHCQDEELNQSSSSDSYRFLQVESEAMTVAIKAWKKCMARESDGLVCYATPAQQGKTITFTVEWHEKHSPADLLVIFNDKDLSPIFKANTSSENNLPLSLKPMGSTKILFERKNEKDSLQVIVNASSVSTQTSCEYEIPSLRASRGEIKITPELEDKLSKRFKLFLETI